MIPNALRALDRMEFRFTDPEDIAKYGDGWWVYDESHWLRLRARDLIDLEAKMGISLASMMNGFRASSTLGDTAAAWLGLYRENSKMAGEFDEFNPVTNLIEWRIQEKVPAAPAATTEVMDQAEPATLPAPDPDSPMPSALPAGPSRNMNSVPTDTVALSNLPEVG